jgi:hypothetical protein
MAMMAALWAVERVSVSTIKCGKFMVISGHMKAMGGLLKSGSFHDA